MSLLAVDGAVPAGARSGDLSAVRYEDGPQRRPYLELLGSEGVVTASAGAPLEPGATPRERVILHGYNHIDLATAAGRQNGGAPEGVSTSLTKFVLQVVGPPGVSEIVPRVLPAIRLSVSPP